MGSVLNADLASFSKDFHVRKIQSNHPSEAVRDAVSQCFAGDFKSGVPALIENAEAGDEDSKFVLAKLVANGVDVPALPRDTEKILRPQAMNGHVASLVAMAELLRSKKPAQALQMYTVAANKNDLVAIVRLGDIYESGALSNVEAKPKLAIQYFRRAAAAGNPYAMFRLGNFCAEGKGVSPNDLVANKFFEQAALAGHAAANTSVAKRYLAGKGLKKDPVAALGWLTRGAKAGDAEAMVLLGQQYEKGKIIKQDINVAGQLYSTAAKANDLAGKYHLAMLYYKGVGTKPDSIRAFVLLYGAQDLPKAKKMFEQIRSELTEEQLKIAKSKIESANSRPASAK